MKAENCKLANSLKGNLSRKLKTKNMKTIYKLRHLPKISLSLLICLLYLSANRSDWGNFAGQCATTTVKKKTATKASSGVTLTTPEPKTPIEHNNRGCELGMKGMWEGAI